ncbi:MAG: hypothetical protein ACXVYB_00150 [Arthrobacter sp.]
MIRLTTAPGKPILVNPRHIMTVSPHEAQGGELTALFMEGPRQIFVRESFYDVEEMIAKEGRTVTGTPLSESD